MGAAAGFRILVVDDDRDTTDSTSTLLNMYGHETLRAYGGRAALDLARTNLPDLVLLDLDMPEVDGYEVARRLRQQPELEQVFILCVSGYGQDKDRLAALMAGCDDHLLKPVEPEDLKDVLARLVAIREQARAVIQESQLQRAESEAQRRELGVSVRRDTV